MSRDIARTEQAILKGGVRVLAERGGLQAAMKRNAWHLRNRRAGGQGEG